MCTYQEETREVQKKNELNIFGREETCNSRRTDAEITVDLVLQARAKMADNKVNGPDDAVVSEMIKQLPWEKIYTITRWFQERFMGQMEAPSSWNIVRLVFLREPRKGIRTYSAIALTSVMSKWYASGIILRVEKEAEPDSWKKLHLGGRNGTCCQSSQTWQCDTADNAFGKLGHRDGIR